MEIKKKKSEENYCFSWVTSLPVITSSSNIVIYFVLKYMQSENHTRGIAFKESSEHISLI